MRKVPSKVFIYFMFIVLNDFQFILYVVIVVFKYLILQVSVALNQDPEFSQVINKLVWNVHISPAEFEEQWQVMVKHYGLENVTWFSNMYEIKRSWIPTYYKDLPMSGLMKTTSRFERANAFFNLYVMYRFDLCEF